MLGGVVINGDFKNVMLVDLVDLQQIQEFVDYVWYCYLDDWLGCYFFDGIIDFWYNLGDVKGSDMYIQQFNEQECYFWIKVLCWWGYVMEVGFVCLNVYCVL